MATRIRRTRAEWRDLLARYERSGLSQQSFCDEHGLALSTFCKWRRELGAVAGTAEPVFAEVEVEHRMQPREQIEPQSNWDIELTLGPGMVLRIRTGC